jgi:DNA-directed RNA polymerase specialized sigma24 family protein
MLVHTLTSPNWSTLQRTFLTSVETLCSPRSAKPIRPISKSFAISAPWHYGQPVNVDPQDDLIPLSPFRNAQFTSTHWSVVVEAAQSQSAQSCLALEKLCGAYWYPLYAFVRRQGYSSSDAEDLTQGFFGWLLESKHLRVADPQLGRFRSFLLCRLKHFLSDECKKARAQKRGGGHFAVSLDAARAEEWYGLEPATTQLSPDLIFDRRWALSILERTVARLRAEYAAADRAELYEQLKHFQPGEAPSRSYAEVAAQLGLTEGAVKSAIYRLRQRHRDLVRDEIAQTVATPSEVDEEIRYLLSMLSEG